MDKVQESELSDLTAVPAELTFLLNQPGAIKDVVKRLRGERGSQYYRWYSITQTELAEELGTNVMKISRLEREGFTDRDVFILRLFAKILENKNEISELIRQPPST